MDKSLDGQEEFGPSGFVSLECLSSWVNLPKEYLRELAKKGQIPHLVVGGRRRFNVWQVTQALKNVAAEPDLKNEFVDDLAIDLMFKWRRGTARRKAKQGVLPHVIDPAGEIKFVREDVMKLVKPVGYTNGTLSES